MSRTLNALVRAALNTAVDKNGETELLTERPETVAVDLAAYDAEIERRVGRYRHKLVPLVKEWQADRAQAVRS